ncbi:hypothetical protein [Trinickia diaoshuihuensis]|jgi:hypothetical protein|uniref:hypothetical protein n=1 Tax=Trinickia diaoshuihuensis TaxID=2292265 RepID=UPI000E2530CE|nr:hypothetical protein [Trinickia diaoshuihuensis]
MPTPTTTIFGTFATTKVTGTTIQIQKALLEEAAISVLGVRNTYKGTMRVFNLAQLYGYRFDFHLSFKLDDSGEWAHSGHFCARDEGVAKNACAYWFYNLVQTNGTNALAWSYEGTAPDNPLYGDFMESIRINTPATSLAAQKMLRRQAAEPLTKLLAKFNSLITQGRAVVVTVRGNAGKTHTRLEFA